MKPDEHRTSTNHFRYYLQQTLVSRCQKNPKYSLRAFAKSLDIVPSALSDMLNGRRTITDGTIQRLGLALGLDLKTIERFKNGRGGKPDSRQLKFQQITLDMFAMISDWYHYAILELMKVRGFNPNTEWICRALGITRSEANVAVERLVRLGLIEIRADGSWEDLSEGFSTNIEPGLTSAASRKLQRQILEQASRRLDEVPLELRNNTSMTMAIDPRDLPEAVNWIAKFRRELCEFLEAREKPTEVYQFAVALFPLTQISKNRKQTGVSL